VTIYYKILSFSDDELLAIHRTTISLGDIAWREINIVTSAQLETDDWWRASATQVEYETYREFGIKEIRCYGGRVKNC